MNLLVTGAWSSAKTNIQKLEQLGHNVIFLQYEQDELPCAYEWVEGVVCNGLFLTHPIEKFTNLRYIQLTSAGFDRVPMDYVREHHIVIHNARGVYSIPMAEFAISSVLQLYKQTQFFHENQKNHVWDKHRQLLELYGKTVCVVGCGSVGTECAKRFSAFGCEVVGVDLYPRKDEWYQKMVPLEKLDIVLGQADVVILTLPLTEQTQYLIDSKRVQLMKDGAVLVNIARGAIIDTEVLLLNSDKLMGVVLDVFEEEPLDKDHALWSMKNAIITPHNSFVGDNNNQRLTEVIINNLSN
mgnify:CR=1 FL=1